MMTVIIIFIWTMMLIIIALVKYNAVLFGVILDKAILGVGYKG